MAKHPYREATDDQAQRAVRLMAAGFDAENLAHMLADSEAVQSEYERLRSELETERGQRQPDNQESRDEVVWLRRLLAELVRAAEEADENGNLVGADEFVERLRAALAAAKEAV